MKRILSGLLLLLVLQAGALLGQTFTGTWQGALKVPQAPNGELRTVFKISINETDKLVAQFWSIDQPGPGLAATTITASGSSLKVTLVPLNGTYEGKLSADGKTVVGTWMQQGRALPLTLSLATPETAWAIPTPPPPPQRMAGNVNPGFDVATIKPSEPGRPGKLSTVRGQNIVTINTTVTDLITMAYNLHAKQIIGAPSWMESDKYDLEVKPDAPGQPNVNQIKIILQKLLADRYQLKFHQDKRQLSIYAITVAKGGPKVTKSQSDPNACLDYSSGDRRRV